MSKASILAGFKTDFQAGISTIKNTTIDDTGFLALPQGTTAQRVGIASTQGMIRITLPLIRWRVIMNQVATGNQLVVVLLVVEVMKYLLKIPWL